MSAELHKDIIQKYTQETDEIVENAVKLIHERSATVTLNHLATIWDTFDDNTKLEIAVLNAGSMNAARFVALMYGLVELNKHNTKENPPIV